MDYHRSLDYLFGLQKFGIKLGLDNIRTLLGRLGSPQLLYPCVHVAGTNGKGSTAVALAGILQNSGYRVGLYTSPHLHSFTERIQVDRQVISEASVVSITARLQGLVTDLPVTFFEMTTAMALEYFRQAKVDIAILETGLGGRLDATNVVTPLVSVITPISYDHAAYLGDDLAAIAAEKGGIIKPGVPVFVARQKPEALKVLQRQAHAVAAEIYAADSDWQIRSGPAGFRFAGLGWNEEVISGLAGMHQHDNLGLSLAVAAYLQSQGWHVARSLAVKSLAELSWPGRLEWWRGEQLLFDAAHNLAGCQALADYLTASGLNRVHLVTGFKADKDWQAMLRVLLPFATRVYVTKPEVEAVVDPVRVVEFVARRGGAASCHLPAEEALDQAFAVRQPGETIVVAGSIFLISVLRNQLLKREKENAESRS
ncbi:MAG TPA: folylpolyglutamate synthase/dihydrofolate synthase family protein [Geothermobacteraceae bacterium]|nr:folylpolyglutamate synthase/dihydrofolate synthase family protein [Geothermobacteraceae bacterium]